MAKKKKKSEPLVEEPKVEEIKELNFDIPTPLEVTKEDVVFVEETQPLTPEEIRFLKRKASLAVQNNK